MTRYRGSEADRWFLAMGLPDMPDREQSHPLEWTLYGLPPRLVENRSDEWYAERAAAIAKWMAEQERRKKIVDEQWQRAAVISSANEADLTEALKEFEAWQMT